MSACACGKTLSHSVYTQCRACWHAETAAKTMRRRVERDKKRAQRAARIDGYLRECSKCGAAHQRKSGWCAACYKCYRAEWDVRPERTGVVGKPPPPPPGFNPADFTLGRPLS